MYLLTGTKKIAGSIVRLRNHEVNVVNSFIQVFRECSPVLWQEDS